MKAQTTLLTDSVAATAESFSRNGGIKVQNGETGASVRDIPLNAAGAAAGGRRNSMQDYASGKQQRRASVDLAASAAMPMSQVENKVSAQVGSSCARRSSGSLTNSASY